MTDIEVIQRYIAENYDNLNQFSNALIPGDQQKAKAFYNRLQRWMGRPSGDLKISNKEELMKLGIDIDELRREYSMKVEEAQAPYNYLSGNISELKRLAEENSALKIRIAKLEGMVELLKEQNEDLLVRLGKDTVNGST